MRGFITTALPAGVLTASVSGAACTRVSSRRFALRARFAPTAAMQHDDAASPRRDEQLLRECGATVSVLPQSMPPAEEVGLPLSEGSSVKPAARGATLAFRAVSVAIPLPRKKAAAAERVLLTNITGVIPGGDMYALMGGSGAGKTTLLDMASQRKTDGRLGGAVLFDGRVPTRSELKRDTAYIQQDDALLGWATVAETLAFTAEMKLPRAMSAADKAARVEEVIEQMGLTLARNTFVGSRLVRGLSGGERKRTGVACGLICKPRCIFMDEPTSGLDSAIAAEVMTSVKALQTTSGCTLLITIHQPSPGVYMLFDGLVLLHRGALCYFGPGRDAPCDFFGAQGFAYRPGWNIAEFLLETISSGSSRAGAAALVIDADAAEAGAAAVAAHDFTAYFAKSELCASQKRMADAAANDNAGAAAASPAGAAVLGIMAKKSRVRDVYVNPAWREMLVLLRFRGVIRYTSSLYIFSRITLFAMLAALFATFFYNQVMDLHGIAAVNSIIFLTVTTPTFLGTVFVQDLISEREVYTREFHDAYYRVVSYVVSKIVADVPAAIISALSYSAILYPSVGLHAGAPSFFFFALATFVNLMIATLVGFTFASMLPGEIAPAVLLPCYATLNTLVAGFLITQNTIPIIWRWLYTISYEQWLWSALMINQFDGQEYSAYCHGAGSTLEAVAALLPGPALAPPAQLGQLAAALGSTSCQPLRGSDLISMFDLGGRNKWGSLGYAALTFPALCVFFYAGVRSVRHERR